jgi:hypothetical protein
MPSLRGLQTLQLIAAISLFVAMQQRSVDALSGMFTAFSDVQRALEDELSAADLLRQYVHLEKQRIGQLEL